MTVTLEGSLFTDIVYGEKKFEKDVIKTAAGDLEIVFIGHASLMMKYDGRTFHIDPFGELADYSQLPRADLVLITHHHMDHLDPEAVNKVRSEDTTIILTEKSAEKLAGGTVMKNGDILTMCSIRIECIPAYNMVHKRANGTLFHPKGECNGYVLTFGNKRVYIAGDTENIPEMKTLTAIDIAFLPMNLPYTMTPEMVADGAKAFMPRTLYPYHYGETNVMKLTELLKNDREIEIRVRMMQ
ncbi:MAG: metal-dependent hydrolase [Syntrophorhabdus sp. PtaU1.Bin050]|nr:MAG: metal-dependent hydrolase [Syntrophorhabdus sp. PtaU1.Bin050]